MNDAQLDCAYVTSSHFGALNAQLTLRDKIQTGSMFSEIRLASRVSDCLAIAKRAHRKTNLIYMKC